MAKFFMFRQNNSGGYFIVNDTVAKFLIIEAKDAEDAVDKMYDITEDYREYCGCCGERWSDSMWNEKGEDVPTVYGLNVLKERPDSPFSQSTIIHYLNGIVEKLWYSEYE